MPTLRIVPIDRSTMSSPEQSPAERGGPSSFTSSTRDEQEEQPPSSSSNHEEDDEYMHQKQEQEKYQAPEKQLREKSGSNSSKTPQPSSAPRRRFVLPMQMSSAERLSRFKKEIEKAEAVICNSEENPRTQISSLIAASTKLHKLKKPKLLMKQVL